jgi:glycosyltransferase 2 family protein
MQRPRPDRRRRHVLVAVQAIAGVAVTVLVAIHVRRSWHEIRPRIADFQLGYAAAALVVITGYYLVFIRGWRMILHAFGYDISYRQAVLADVVSMLAKYVPGGVWTPAARVVMCRRYGVPAGVVLASIGYEAGLSAIAGMLVFLVALAFHAPVHLPVPAWVIVAGAAACLALLHPRIYGAAADRVLRRPGQPPIPRLPTLTALRILVYYAATWLLSGLATAFMVAAVQPISLTDQTVYLAGVSAVGAIVTVIAFFTPSGLGAREGAMYALLIPIVSAPAALVAVALSRIVITLSELVILAGAGGLRLGRLWRLGPDLPPPGASLDEP